MGNKYTESQKKATYKYIQSKKRHTLALESDESDFLIEKIKSTGYVSVNSFLRDAAYFYLEHLEKEEKEK